MESKLWIVGQVKTNRPVQNDPHPVYEWEFQGVFDSETKAVAACRTAMYFVMPCELNKALPDESVIAPGAYYPLGEKG